IVAFARSSFGLLSLEEGVDELGRLLCNACARPGLAGSRSRSWSWCGSVGDDDHAPVLITGLKRRQCVPTARDLLFSTFALEGANEALVRAGACRIREPWPHRQGTRGAPEASRIGAVRAGT